MIMISSDLLYLRVPSHKDKIRKISSVTPTGVLTENKSVKYKFCNSYGSPG